MKQFNFDKQAYIQLENGAVIHKSASFPSTVEVGSNTIIEASSIIGKLLRDDLRSILIPEKHTTSTDQKIVTTVGSHCHIQAGTIIYSGASLGNNVICGEQSYIGRGACIGNNTKIHYRAQIFKRVSIGSHSRIGGFVCNDCVIGDYSSVYGSLVHKYLKHGVAEENPLDSSPKIGNNVIIAFNSTIIGGINIGDNSYICAGAVVTKDIPPNVIVKKINQIESRG
ncbi:hypothetical protein COB64_03845 [Candidatus Wolfebacteria bacterium]|nr:MAG: hypothetical protein COB64_03845 [Candidatus Wolfebacteria bacterium]